jgi:hypothetical protein
MLLDVLAVRLLAVFTGGLLLYLLLCCLVCFFPDGCWLALLKGVSLACLMFSVRAYSQVFYELPNWTFCLV